ncbi:MAG TPA: YciI family protein [Dongiaceae bacterium]|nr:YciI family protein [Dongiaceae bacterium]
MQYLLLIYNDEERARAIPMDDMNKMLPAFTAYTEALKKAGILLGGNRLQFSSNATTVRIQDGKTKVLNGPYAEAKEQLGGYYLIDVPDMDSALSWAARCPGANYGTVEVRPIWAMQ